MAMDLLGTLLGGMTSQSSLSSLAGKTGASTDQVSGLLSSALPLLMGQVTSNASTGKFGFDGKADQDCGDFMSTIYLIKEHQ